MSEHDRAVYWSGVPVGHVRTAQKSPLKERQLWTSLHSRSGVQFQSELLLITTRIWSQLSRPWGGTYTRVLVVGSVPKLETGQPDLMIAERFNQACQQLGAALARAGIALVVGSRDANTADRAVIEGAATVEGRHKVWMIEPEKRFERTEDPPLIINSQRIDLFRRSEPGTWAAGEVPGRV